MTSPHQLHYGEITQKKSVVMHTCDTPSCVNPSHLWLGTYKENTADMIRKGRHARQAPVGEASGKSVLTEAIVRYIRGSGSKNVALARELGCGVNTVRGVRIGRTWTHVK